MNNKSLTESLASLMQLDIDAAEAYEQALKNIDTPAVYARIKEFQQDHLRHIDDLESLIKVMGGEPPVRSKDFKGFLIKGFTAIRSLTGIKGALKAMQGNEELTTKTYREALQWDLTPEARGLIENNYQDEQRHLTYIQQILTSPELN